ncbi:MAG TPA: CHAT domain-containing protein, partial [Kofleriaceae bacterium]|nr:CHAT domain-containing protein [Kofleriaceae bacterium]
ELARAPACDADPATQRARAVQTALVRTELARLGGRDDDRARAEAALAAVRDAPDLSDAQRSLIAYIEGDLVIGRDRAAGERWLREAIARTAQPPDDLGYLVRTRAYSFALLALTAGRAGDFAGVLRVVGEQLAVPVAACTVAIAVQDRQSVVALADDHGAVTGAYVAHHDRPVDPAALVAPALADHLRACGRVRVLAGAPVLGAARVLPPSIAWSFALPHTAPPTPTPAPGPALVVADPEPPAELQLPPLAPYPDPPARDRQILRGADATPGRVLAAMRDAAVIEFHTHGFIANDVSEASYLALTPGLDHQYALTARDVAGAALTRAPLVILGACHAATSSRSLEGGTGLAEAFLRAGARAVIASPDAVRDREGHAVFARVRDRVAAGDDPAVAVRDARLAARGDDWVASVVVFE